MADELFTLELTAYELRKLDRLLSVDFGSKTSLGIRAKLTPLLPTPVVKCYDCREVQETEAGYEKHLRTKHHYRRTYREDDSYGTAWDGFHKQTRCLKTGPHSH